MGPLALFAPSRSLSLEGLTKALNPLGIESGRRTRREKPTGKPPSIARAIKMAQLCQSPKSSPKCPRPQPPTRRRATDGVRRRPDVVERARKLPTHTLYNGRWKVSKWRSGERRVRFLGRRRGRWRKVRSINTDVTKWAISQQPVNDVYA